MSVRFGMGISGPFRRWLGNRSGKGGEASCQKSGPPFFAFCNTGSAFLQRVHAARSHRHRIDALVPPNFCDFFSKPPLAIM